MSAATAPRQAPDGATVACSPTDRLREAIGCYQNGAFAEAAARFANLARHHPKDATVLRLLGLARVRAGDIAGGLPPLARARHLNPRDPLTHLHHGIGLQQAGRHARAAALFRRAATLTPNEPAPWFNFSAALLALGQAKAARAAARRAVRLAPGTAACWHALGLAERAEGDLGSARTAFARALGADRGSPLIWVDYGLACYQLGDITSALNAMRTALAARPDFMPARVNLSAFRLLIGEAEDAAAGLRDILRQDPGNAAARINLANLLLLEHDAPAALALLDGEPPAGRDGKHWRAHRAMALLSTGQREAARAELDAIPEPYGDVEILMLWRRITLLPHGDAEADTLATRMGELAGNDTAALLEHRVVAFFDLARFHHDRGRADAAFDNWRHGHRLLARIQPFSRDQYRAFVDATMDRYDTARLREGPRAANTDATPVFIVGMPRSGTSLTEQVLAAHRDVFGAGERVAIHRLLNELAGNTDSAVGVHAAVALDTETLTGAAHRFLRELHAEAPGKPIVLDKMPGNARHLGFIASLLPGAKIIHCRRDPRDTGLSIFQHRFFGYHPYAHDLADLGWAIGEHERLMAHWRGVLPLPMIEVDLEDWVRDFGGTLARVLSFLGLPHDPACERFYEQTRTVRTASALQVRQPINARGIGRWRLYETQLQPLIAELRDTGPDNVQMADRSLRASCEPISTSEQLT